MPFGFMCGDGWYWPIYRFSDIVEAINVLVSHFNVWVEITELKEKFGTCTIYFFINYRLSFWKRFVNWLLNPIVWLTKNYNIGFGPSEKQMALMSGLNEIVEKLVDECEKECMNYCEDCGLQFGSWNKDKRVATRGWISIICQDCAEKTNRLYVPYPDLNKDPLAEEQKS